MSRQTERRAALLASKEVERTLRSSLHALKPRTEIERMKDDATKQLNYAYDRMQEVQDANLSLSNSIMNVILTTIQAATLGENYANELMTTRADSLQRNMDAAIHALTERGQYTGDNANISSARAMLEALRGQNPVDDMEFYITYRHPALKQVIELAREGKRIKSNVAE